jgi:hypothetical protein
MRKQLAFVLALSAIALVGCGQSSTTTDNTATTTAPAVTTTTANQAQAPAAGQAQAPAAAAPAATAPESKPSALNNVPKLAADTTTTPAQQAATNVPASTDANAATTVAPTTTAPTTDANAPSGDDNGNNVPVDQQDQD